MSDYFLNLGACGVLVSPDKFIQKQPNDWGFTYAKTPLTHLQRSLKEHDNHVFLHDAYDRKRLEKISIAELKIAVSSAVEKYRSYHQKATPENDRGLKAGFFSFFRHGAKGLAVAGTFGNEFGTVTTAADGIAKIRDFLAEPSRAFHNHSFATYLAESIAEQGFVALHKKQHYAQASLVSELNQWIKYNDRTESSLVMN